VERKGEEKGGLRQNNLPKTGSAGLNTGSAGFAAARPEKDRKKLLHSLLHTADRLTDAQMADSQKSG
jgi:hypothetical protein